MKIIVGLGNPGKKYEKTRHNAGFFALDVLIEFLKDENYEVSNFKLEKKFESEVAKLDINGEKVWLVKPQTFMNNSGIAVRKIMDFNKLDTSDLIVLHDDMDIDLGKLKLKETGSSAGHNGVKSIIDHIGTDLFFRVRIGVGRPEKGQDPSDYVLGRFSKEEMGVLEDSIKKFIANSIKYISFI